MTREEMWKEFENQLISETRTPITMSFDNAEKLTKLGIKETVAKWKRRLEQTKWIPVSERLPEIKQHVLLSCYGRVIYGRMISEDGNSGYPVFEICDSVGEKRPIVLETTVHSEFTTSRIKAWMPLPQPYKAESEVQDAVSD